MGRFRLATLASRLRGFPGTFGPDFPLLRATGWALAWAGIPCLLLSVWLVQVEGIAPAQGMATALACALLLLPLGVAALHAAFAQGRTVAQERLRLDGQRWQLALEATNDGIWDWNPATHRTFYSSRWKTMLGYGEEEIGDGEEEWWSRIHPQDHPLVMEEIQRHLRGETEFIHSQHRLRRKDGSYLWILDRGRATFDANGKPLRVAGSHTDISERRQFNAALLDLNEQFAAFFSLSPGGFLSLDGEGRIQMANPAFLRMTGIAPERIMHRPLADLDAHLAGLVADPAAFQGLLAHVNEAGTPAGRKRLELEVPEHTVLDISGMSVKSQFIAKLLYLHDVTHEVEVDRMKTEFLSTAAHELRTPLSSIYGFTEYLLLNDCNLETRTDLLQTILRQSGLLARITNDLLDLACIEARRDQDFVYQSVDVPGLLRETLRDFFLDREKWPLRFDAGAGTALYVRADPDKLRQALANILDNARKYSPNGGALEVACWRQPRGDELGIRIRDHGIGMKRDQMRRIFERFYRADASGRFPGTGLGMSIVKEIVELHGGRVEVASEYGVGTEVTLWLPLAPQAQER